MDVRKYEMRFMIIDTCEIIINNHTCEIIINNHTCEIIDFISGGKINKPLILYNIILL